MAPHGKARRSRSTSSLYDDKDADLRDVFRQSQEMTESAHSDDDNDIALAYQYPDLAKYLDSESSGTCVEGKAIPESNSDDCIEARKQAEESSPWVSYTSKVADYVLEIPDGKPFSSLAAFFHHLTSAQCSTCGQGFFQSELDVSVVLKN
jgi:hypothetical protein